MVISREDKLKKLYSHELLTETELNIVEDFIVLLKPFQELTVLISASTYVTSSIVLPAITRLTEVLHLYTSSHRFSFLDDLAVKMSDKLEDRCKAFFENSLLLASCFMDPRFKSLKFIKDQNKRDKALFDAMTYIKNVYKHKLKR
jgi:hypothetical protein